MTKYRNSLCDVMPKLYRVLSVVMYCSINL